MVLFIGGLKKGLFLLFIVLLIAANVFLLLLPKQKVFSQTNPPSLSNISDNRSEYPNNSVPKYEKLEITFQVQTTASNLQWPYDPNTPSGITSGLGITVNAVFTSPTGKITTQPAYHHQDYDYQVKNGQDWFYPTNNYSWKVRFTPDETGAWQYVLTAQDSGGTISSSPQSFTTTTSNNPGFVRVSQKDSRYFEYDDGTYFPSLGYNMNYDNINWMNPIQANQANFQIMGQNGIQVIRHWLSQWGIFSSNDISWGSMKNGPDDAGISVPYISQTINGQTVSTRVPAYPGSDVAMRVENYWEPCMILSGWQQRIPVKPNTKYHVFIRYLIPQGQWIQTGSLGAKLGNWINSPSCADANTGYPITLTGATLPNTSPLDNNGNATWSILEGTFESQNVPINNNSTIPMFYLYIYGVDNINKPTTPTTAGEKIFIDRVEIREDPTDLNDPCRRAGGSGSQFDLTQGSCGVNIIGKPWMSHYQYMDQQQSARFDKVLDLAKQNDVFLKLVLLEKNEYISNHIDYNGNTILDNQTACNPPNGTIPCPGNQWFYGNWRTMTKIRWLQQTWWRYLQARWGYSPNVHSWELLNEGDPYSGLHYALADELGKYMHQFGSNSHLVTTSMWNSFPTIPFWRSSDYPNLDYADVHQYNFKNQSTDLRIDDGTTGYIHLFDANNAQYFDTALNTKVISDAVGAKQPHGVGKPIMRGETGFVTAGNTDSWDPDLINLDTQGLWLHNYLWGQINPSGLIESYWYDDTHIWNNNSYNGPIFDHRNIFGTYYRFIKDIPLSNGHYTDASASITNSSLRVWGQKDLVNGNAHLWIANPAHTWKNVVDNATIAPLSSSVTLTGFTSNKVYTLEWWDTYTGQIDPSLGPSSTTADANGNLAFSVSNLKADLALKILSGDPPVLPKEGDLNNDLSVNILDLRYFLSRFLNLFTIFDYNKMVENFGI